MIFIKINKQINFSQVDIKIYTRPIIVFTLATICCFLWGSVIPVLKISYRILNIENANYLVKMQFAGYRFFLSGLFLTLFLFLKNKNMKITKKNIRYLIILGFFQTALMYAFLYNGLANVSSVKSSIMMSLTTFFAVIFSGFIFKYDKINIKKIFGLLLGFSGLIYVNVTEISLGINFSFSGEGLLILYALVDTISSILAKKFSKNFEIIVMVSYQMLIGSLIMIMYSSLLLGGSKINLNISFLPILIYLSLVSSFVFSVWYFLLSMNKVSEITMYKFQIPLWGSVLSVILLPNEQLNISIIISLILVSVGIYLANAPSKYLRNKFRI